MAITLEMLGLKFCVDTSASIIRSMGVYDWISVDPKMVEVRGFLGVIKEQQNCMCIVYMLG